jgi:hypothetical protein
VRTRACALARCAPLSAAARRSVAASLPAAAHTLWSACTHALAQSFHASRAVGSLSPQEAIRADYAARLERKKGPGVAKPDMQVLELTRTRLCS